MSFARIEATKPYAEQAKKQSMAALRKQNCKEKVTPDD